MFYLLNCDHNFNMDKKINNRWDQRSVEQAWQKGKVMIKELNMFIFIFTCRVSPGCEHMERANGKPWCNLYRPHSREIIDLHLVASVCLSLCQRSHLWMLLTMFRLCGPGPCGPRKTPKLCRVPQPSESQTYQNCILLCLFFTILNLIAGVRTDPTGTKLISFFCKSGWGLRVG